jgi:hypothetical protein
MLSKDGLRRFDGRGQVKNNTPVGSIYRTLYLHACVQLLVLNLTLLCILSYTYCSLLVSSEDCMDGHTSKILGVLRQGLHLPELARASAGNLKTKSQERMTTKKQQISKQATKTTIGRTTGPLRPESGRGQP